MRPRDAFGDMAAGLMVLSLSRVSDWLITSVYVMIRRAAKMMRRAFRDAASR